MQKLTRFLNTQPYRALIYFAVLQGFRYASPNPLLPPPLSGENNPCTVAPKGAHHADSTCNLLLRWANHHQNICHFFCKNMK